MPLHGAVVKANELRAEARSLHQVDEHVERRRLAGAKVARKLARALAAAKEHQLVETRLFRGEEERAAHQIGDALRALERLIEKHEAGVDHRVEQSVR